MGFRPLRTSTFTIVRSVTVSEQTLKRIAEALGIPEAEHDRITSISGEIHIGPAPSPAGGSASPTSEGERSPPTSQDAGSPRTLPSAPQR
jgi:hypothetical protein